MYRKIGENERKQIIQFIEDYCSKHKKAGSRELTAQLNLNGFQVSHKTVYRIMKRLGLITNKPYKLKDFRVKYKIQRVNLEKIRKENIWFELDFTEISRLSSGKRSTIRFKGEKLKFENFGLPTITIGFIVKVLNLKKYGFKENAVLPIASHIHYGKENTKETIRLVEKVKEQLREQYLIIDEKTKNEFQIYCLGNGIKAYGIHSMGGTSKPHVESMFSTLRKYLAKYNEELKESIVNRDLQKILDIIKLCVELTISSYTYNYLLKLKKVKELNRLVETEKTTIQPILWIN